MEINLKERIEVKDLNGNTTTIKGSVVNHIITEGTYSFNEATQVALVDWCEYHFYLGPDKVEITDPKGRVRGSNSSDGYGSRNCHLSDANRKVSLSRMWCLVKALHYKALPLYKVDKFVHNHLDNQGYIEAMIQGKIGLDISNYELCSYSQNTKHAEAWHNIKDYTGRELKFSAYNTAFINYINAISSDKKLSDEEKSDIINRFVSEFIK